MSKSTTKISKILSAWIPVLIWAGLIFTLSSIPSFPSSRIIWWDFIIKKTAHIIEYAILFTLMIRAFNLVKGHKEFNKKVAVTSLIICILYAVSDEYHQRFTPGRHPHVMDVGFDTTGATTALLFIKNTKLNIIRNKIFAK